MAWVRVDDQWPTHPKVMGLSMAARGLWITAACHCNAHRTDGLIRGSAISGMAKISKRGTTKLVDELVGAGLWVKVGEDYRIHDYHDYQPSSSELDERDVRISSARRSAGSTGGKRSAESRRAKQTGSKPEAPIPSPIPNSTTATTTNTRAHENPVEELPEPPTSPSPTNLPHTMFAPVVGSADKASLVQFPVDDLELPPELRPLDSEENTLGPLSLRGGSISPRPPPTHAKRTQEPPSGDTSPRANLVRTMLGIEAFRTVEETYGSQHDSPLIEIFADHCLGTAVTIGCPLSRLPDVAVEVAVDLSGMALLHGAPMKPDVWTTKLAKFIRGAKNWKHDKTLSPTAPTGTSGGRGEVGGPIRNGEPRVIQQQKRKGPVVQRDRSGACGTAAAERHSSEHASELFKIGKKLGY